MTREVAVGNVTIGGRNDIAIQSMTNIPTRDIAANVLQICELAECGCDIVRLAIGSVDDVKSLAKIKKILLSKGVTIPLVADVHFSPTIASDCLGIAHKVRINAGNFSDKMAHSKQFSDEEFSSGRQILVEKLRTLFSRAKDTKTTLRVGINCGSLAPRIVHKFGSGDVAMWESARECIDAANGVQFRDLILSFKASDAKKMIAANRMACSKMDEIGWDFPLHLGVTEAGDGNYGRIKSAIGIGTLLVDGIGDTIRVSLTEDPSNEIAAAKDILQACGARRYVAEIISCPSCGRTSYDISATLARIRDWIKKIPRAGHLKIAVMGCMVNGLGESKNADFSVIGTPSGNLAIYRGENRMANGIHPDKICEKLEEIMAHFGV